MLLRDKDSKVQLSDKYGECCKQSLSMIAEFYFMWNNHPDLINMVLRCAKLARNNTEPIRFTL